MDSLEPLVSMAEFQIVRGERRFPRGHTVQGPPPAELGGLRVSGPAVQPVSLAELLTSRGLTPEDVVGIEGGHSLRRGVQCPHAEALAMSELCY